MQSAKSPVKLKRAVEKEQAKVELHDLQRQQMFQFFKDFFDKHPKQEEGVEKTEVITDMFKKHY